MTVDGIPDVCLAVFFLEREAEHHVGVFVRRGPVEGVQSVRAADGICRKAEIAQHAVDCGDRHKRLVQWVDGKSFVGRGEADGRRDGRLVHSDAFHDRRVEAERGLARRVDIEARATFARRQFRPTSSAPGADAGQDLVHPVARPRFVLPSLGHDSYVDTPASNQGAAEAAKADMAIAAAMARRILTTKTILLIFAIANSSLLCTCQAGPTPGTRRRLGRRLLLLYQNYVSST